MLDLGRSIFLFCSGLLQSWIRISEELISWFQVRYIWNPRSNSKISVSVNLGFILHFHFLTKIRCKGLLHLSGSVVNQYHYLDQLLWPLCSSRCIACFLSQHHSPACLLYSDHSLHLCSSLCMCFHSLQWSELGLPEAFATHTHLM